jgi:hypothetical protein
VQPGCSRAATHESLCDTANEMPGFNSAAFKLFEAQHLVERLAVRSRIEEPVTADPQHRPRQQRRDRMFIGRSNKYSAISSSCIEARSMIFQHRVGQSSPRSVYATSCGARAIRRKPPCRDTLVDGLNIAMPSPHVRRTTALFFHRRDRGAAVNREDGQIVAPIFVSLVVLICGVCRRRRSARH